ncbi:ROK family transcriptional regulator [Glaciihabitans sp. UYNi722]|uniref:ROK family transcriptional regulator n=1 Tax=Glaciihabitans sp. UYNi722 TaxID=3156344 RepID=UPI003393A255
MTVAESAQAGRGNSNDHVRRHNLSVILGLVHRARGLSRAQLTRQTGLNRSTVAALVAELVERELVVESEPDSSNQVGRPSPIVRPSPAVVGIAINPEIDAVTVGVVGLGGTVLKRVRHATGHPPSVEEAVQISAAVIAGMRPELDASYRTVGVGVAVPGLVRVEDGLVRLAPHLRWEDEPLAAMLAEATGLPVLAANDAHLGTMAESTFGAGRGLTDLIYLNGGASGIGGGIISGGNSLGGVAGYAGELGHTLVNSVGVRCHCGAIGCLETEARREHLLQVVGLTDADADDLETAILASTEPAVLAEVHRQLRFLAIALRNAINTLNPQLIVLGGFLGTLYAAAPGVLDDLLAEQPLKASRESVRVTRAELGRDLLIIGAGELAFQPLIADPAGFVPPTRE